MRSFINIHSIQQKPLIAWVFVLVIASRWSQAADIYYYPKPESAVDARQSYPIALLEKCSQSSNNQWTVAPSQLLMNQGRALKQVMHGKGVDVVWTATSVARESALNPVRIPIDRGLLGWRLLLINQDEQRRFSQIDSISELKKLSAGQGHDWPDTQILKAEGFTITTNPNYAPLFPMLRLKHIDYFPRSLAEIQREVNSHSLDGFTIEKNILLHYPSALYFFVSYENKLLHDRLTQCLTEMTTSGDLKRLFYQYYGSDIENAHLDQRKLFEVPNPLLPPETPLHNEQLWYKISEPRL